MQLINNKYQVQNINLLDLVKEFGDPVYVYDADKIKEQYDNLYQPNNPNQYNIPKLKGNLARAVRNQGILAFRFIERFDAEPER